ncbi:MAG: ROK family transcriptional regulator [Acidobacteriota bacterium]|nr:ROK family transcriptional regulator [Acidobacteriota bacterium]
MVRRINLEDVNVARSSTIRDINRQIILNHIREKSPISRADIARLTALQRSTVSLIVEELKNIGLIEEIEGESSGGRPPQLLSLRTAHAVAVGVDFGTKRTIVAASDLAGRVLEQEEFPTDKDFEVTIERIIRSVKYLVQKNGGSIEGIGVSVPALVEPRSGKVLLVPHLNWHEPAFAERLKIATGLPVKIDNDANAAALAELWFGRPEVSAVRDFILVLIENGIGTGIVFDGQIYRGKGGIAGEFGHMTIGENAPVACAAGKYNCWEAFASERSAIARYLNLHKKRDGAGKIIFAELIDLALEGDEKARTALKQTAHYIGVGIANLFQGLSPEVAIVTGTIVRAWSLIADDIKEGAEAANCQGYPTARFIPSTLGAYPTLMGALSLILTDKFASAASN